MGEEKKVVRSMLFKSNAYIKSIMTANIALCLYWLSWRRKCVLFKKKRSFQRLRYLSVNVILYFRF